ncbi:thiolase domain-containing protein [Sphingobium phenoxybenzoativorans]|uniref:thiolase domain-containing protein n=1 Tax=Sphingobium phenoxybenzoativorans TaxID=1592790 RepID=UPI0008733554|nr:thiolase domain-containing protein [Sphingobium phenoxybenzoativorans]
MSQAYIVGAFEHPTRLAVEQSVAQLHAEVAIGALEDAGLSRHDVDGYLCAGDAPGIGPLSIVEYLGLDVRYADSTDIGGSAPIAHVAHAAQAIAAGRCNVALITLAGRPRAAMERAGLVTEYTDYPESLFELPYRPILAASYAMCAKRHMHEFGTTSEQLAWVKVAASQHAQHNPNALLRKVVTVDDVLGSPMIADPLHRLDCCVTTDGGGAIIVAREEIARSLCRPLVRLRGAGESIKYQLGSGFDLTTTAGKKSGAQAFAQAGVSPADIKYLSTYDSFTITVLLALEDLGFCAKGEGGRFVEDGQLISGIGRLPVNTDGGGLCNNHPAHRGGVTKIIEAVRQLRGEAHPAVQVKNCDLAVAHGTGGMLDRRHGCATAIFERL